MISGLTLLETLSSYVPTLITRRLTENPLPLGQAAEDEFSAALLFADISGFTALTEKLARQGAVGAELLSGMLNEYFSQLIALITGHGGDVVKFAGDALLAVWRVGEDELETVTRWAAQCALLAQEQLSGYRVAGGHELRLKVTLSVGEVRMAQVGGMYGRWEPLLVGSPVAEVAWAEKQARPGQVVLAPGAWEVVKPYAQGVLLSYGRRLEAIKNWLPLRELSALAPSAEVAQALRPYIPGAIRARLSAGQSDWLAELRRVTVLFVNLPDLSEKKSLQEAQTVMHTLQEALYHYEGSVNKLSIDDKGITLVAALGLHPLAHEDDASRGVQAALDMQEALRALNIRCAIGVTTGRAFCGSIGSPQRREYTMIGDVVNLAARLMQHAPEQILCDEATYFASQATIHFEALPPVQLKGKRQPVVCYRPLTERKKVVRTPTELIGRTRERKLFANALQQLLNHEGQVLILEGQAGVGKSRLLEELQRQAKALDVKVLFGAGDAVEKSTPYYVWRDIFEQVFRLTTITDNEERRQQLQEQLTEEEWLLAPLLNAFLSLELPETDLTTDMTGKVRAENLRMLLVQRLQREIAENVHVLILEDVQWVDSASWALIYSVVQTVHPLLVVMATRPLDNPVLEDYLSLLQEEKSQHVSLDTLSKEDTAHLIAQRLGVVNLPTEVLELVYRKAEGNPFFTEELTYALREHGFIMIIPSQGEEAARCQLSPHVDLSTLTLPDTVQGIITSRIDQLSPQLQLTLKVASVIGRVFGFRLLQTIYPIAADKPHLANHLGTLSRLDITPVEDSESDLAYIFKHLITQEVAYNLLLFSQRRDLHEAVAKWYERTFANDLATYYPILAYHWRKAEMMPQAIGYLGKAGEQALHQYANQEAVKFLSEALRLQRQWQASESQYASSHTHIPAIGHNKQHPRSPKTHLSAEHLRQARWERQLGSAYFNLGNLPEARRHLQQALALLDYPVPTTRQKLVLNFVRQVARQCWHRLYPSRAVNHQIAEPTDHEQVRLLESARACEPLGQIYFFATDIVGSIYLLLKMLNLAERASLSSVRARAYGMMCVAAGFIPLHPLARHYSDYAIQVAEETNHLPTQIQVGVTTALYAVGVGSRWAEVRRDLQDVIALCQRLGDTRRLGEAITILGAAVCYHEDLAEGYRIYCELYDMACRHEDPQQQIWALYGKALTILFHLDAPDEALTLLAQAQQLLADGDRISEFTIHAVSALAYLHQGDKKLACRAAEEAVEIIYQNAPTGFAAHSGYTSCLDTYLTLWEEDPEMVSPVWRQHSDKIFKGLKSLARTLPITKPSALRYEGRYEWLKNRPKKAFRCWEKGLALARQLQLPYEEGRILYEIGRRSSGEKRNRCLQEAKELFHRCNVASESRRVQKALAIH